MNTESIKYSRSLPLRYEADIAVMGGGIAGVSAACAAAKSGASVILVERMAVTGGDMTSGGVHALCGETRGQGEIFDEIITGLEAFNAVLPYEGPYRPFIDKHEFRLMDHELLAVVLQELLLRHNVKLLLHTRFVDALVEDDRVDKCIVCGASGPEGLQARQYIDATGEACLAYAAGFGTLKGRPSDGLQLPMSLMFFVREVDPSDIHSHVPPGWFKQYVSSKDLPMANVWRGDPRRGMKAIKVKVHGFDSTDTESLTAAEIAGRRKAMSVLDYFQRVENKPWVFDFCAPVIGIREGRRIVGDYTLTEEDVRNGHTFDDAVARGVFYLDAHDPTTEKHVDQISDNADKAVPPYHIPFRALLVKGARNLMGVGRCLSADHMAQSSARISTSCSMMGQAAGIAAGMAVRGDMELRALDYGNIRNAVEDRGGILKL